MRGKKPEIRAGANLCECSVESKRVQHRGLPLVVGVLEVEGMHMDVFLVLAAILFLGEVEGRCVSH